MKAISALVSATTLVVALTSVVACGNRSEDGFRGDIALDVANPDRCDPLDPRDCLLPFPSDTFTVADASTPTGRRVQLERESMPANAGGVRVDPAEWNRNDGFSPGAQIATFVPGLDLARSGAPLLTDIGRSLDEDSPIVLLDATTGERRPFWSERDASVSSEANSLLFVRPAINLVESHRYVVALRRLVDGKGDDIPPSDAFRAYRDRLRTDVPEVEARRPRYEQVFRDLDRSGVARDDLFLAWDFTVGSRENTTGRLLAMRDDAFGALGADAPRFAVTEVENDVDEFVARRIHGTFEVPLYMTGGGVAGTRLAYGADGRPVRTGSYTASFRCIVPHAALCEAGRPAVYGHGLLGSEGEVSAGNVRRMAEEHDFVFCATKWIGMSSEDVLNAAEILQDLSKFPTLADRLQQGVLNTLFLGRLMIHERGLVSDPAFQSSGRPVIDRRELFYDGNSQGGIMGGIATAVSIDWRRAVLGVPGMNYSTLLQRSSDWDTYRQIYDPSYPDEVSRALGLILIQMLWDRGEANGYAAHLTDDPLPGTPEHIVLMHIAFGDWQVSQYAAEVEARTIGARLLRPAVAEGRMPGFTVPFWGLDPVPEFPWRGSAIVYWDSGTARPPIENVAPTDGRDPHEDPRADPAARAQKSEFLRSDGAVVDVCDGAPCSADPT